MTPREIPTLRDLTWHLPALLATIALVASSIIAFVFGVTRPLHLLAIFGGSLAAVFLAAFVAISILAVSDPWVWDTVERVSNRLIELMFRLPGASTGEEGFVGRRGVVIEAFRASDGDPAKGRVRVSGESWAAVADPPTTELSNGEEIIVRKVRGLTLVVERSAASDG